MIVVHRSLRVRHVTEAAGDMLPIKQADKGRILTEFNLALGELDVAKEATLVMKAETTFETTSSREGHGASPWRGQRGPDQPVGT